MLFLAGLTLIACAPMNGSNATSRETTVPATGVWGSFQANLLMTASTAQIELDCGSVRFDEPISFDDKGRFVAQGVMTQYTPGPDRADEGPIAGTPVTITGQISDKIMTLSMQVGGEAAPREFTLQKNRRGRIIRCL